jgi:hypothetical protein
MSSRSSYRTGHHDAHHGHAKLKPDIDAPDWGDEECLIPGNTGPLEYCTLEPTYCTLLYASSSSSTQFDHVALLYPTYKTPNTRSEN